MSLITPTKNSKHQKLSLALPTYLVHEEIFLSFGNEEYLTFRNQDQDGFSQRSNDIMLKEHLLENKNEKSQNVRKRPEVSGNNFFEETEILESKSGYKWQCIPKVRKFAVSRGEICQACLCCNYVPTKKDIYLEPSCGHEMHHECNIGQSKSQWTFGGAYDGFNIQKDCPCCYVEELYGCDVLKKQIK